MSQWSEVWTDSIFFNGEVYDGRGTLEEGETAEARFIKIQAAYELLIDEEKRSKYDMDNRVNRMKVRVLCASYLATVTLCRLHMV